MHYLKRISRKNGEDAMSPVVGVMLMLVVTVIVAAVVSGLAGSLVSTPESAPTIGMDVQIKNTGLFASSVFEAKVTRVSEPIPTKDLKLVTSWKSGEDSGGATVTNANNVFGFLFTKGVEIPGVAPWGYGPGVADMNSGIPNAKDQQFGNYTLIGGTVMYAYPAGQSGGYMTEADTSGYGVADTKGTYTGWTYTAGTQIDGMQAVLGEGWETLGSGNTVNVKLIHIPSGATIYEKDVVVS